MVNGPRSFSGGLVRAVRQEDLKNRPLIADNIQAGSLDNFTGTSAIAIGSRMARKMGVGIGDSLVLISPQSTATVAGSIPRKKTYEIVAIFEVGMHEYDSTFLYMPLEAAQLFFRLQGHVNAIETFVEDPDITRKIRGQVQAAAGEGFSTLDWQQSNSSFFAAIQIERNVMFLILSLIILVAAFNILSGQTMLVKDKGQDIAILRTMGATRGMILRIFFLSGASIGVVGTVLGFLLGLAFAENIETIRGWLQNLTGTTIFDAEIYFLSQLPAEVDPWEVFQVVGMALFWSFLAPLFPAWRAARLDPVEALRYE